MEIEVAKKLEDMSMSELIQVFMKFRMENREAFMELKEIIDDIV